MNKRINKQAGIIAIELVLLVLLLSVVAFVGYKVLHAKGAVEDANGSIDSTQTVNKKVVNKEATAPEIKSKDDLDKANSSLDQVNPDASNSDSTRLDSQLSF